MSHVTKLKAFADDKLNIGKMMISLNNRVKNTGILRTKSVTKKEMNKCMAEIYDPGGIRTRAARLISQYHNH